MDCWRTSRACWLCLALGGSSAGCAIGPHQTAESNVHSTPPIAASVPLPPATTNPASTPATAATPPVEFATILAEIQQLGASDPAAQSALLEDMKRTDPTLWPQLVQTFRSSAAYHRQLEERRLAAQASTV